MNRKFRQTVSTVSRWALILGVSVLLGVGVPLVSWGQEDLPEGFVTQKAPAVPSAEQIESGKRVYFTKMCLVSWRRRGR